MVYLKTQIGAPSPRWMPTKPGRIATIPITKAFLGKTEARMERLQKLIVTEISPDGEEMDATDYEANAEETVAGRRGHTGRPSGDQAGTI
jgi:hypothetical protein